MIANAKIARKAENFRKALASLSKALSTPITEDRDRAGIIKDFEIVYELSWTLLKLILAEGGQETTGPKDVFSKAFQQSLIQNESTWLEIIKDRNLTVHTYNQPLANEMVQRISSRYKSAFDQLSANLK